jgi:hypothetical protein
MMCVIPNIPWIASLYLNGSQYGCTAVGCVACTLCAHLWEVAAPWNLSFVPELSVKVCPNCQAQCLSQFQQTANIKFMGSLWKSAAKRCVWLVQPLQKWAITPGRRASQWETFNWKRFQRWRCWTTGNNQWGCKWSGYLVCGSAQAILTEELQVRQFCSSITDRRSAALLRDKCKWIVWEVS